MVSENKILTVSYGTFSCTLEGFEDPFSTMKAIAEYFRDLAAEDRYFGAEPPQPDPEAMQRLAETAGQTRVNAQVSDNNVILRQDNDSVPSVAPAATAATAAVVSAAAVTAPEPTLSAPTASMESVAAKLRRIRAVAARDTSDDALFSEDQHADAFIMNGDAATSEAELAPKKPDQARSVHDEVPSQHKDTPAPTDGVPADAVVPEAAVGDKPVAPQNETAPEEVDAVESNALPKAPAEPVAKAASIAAPTTEQDSTPDNNSDDSSGDQPVSEAALADTSTTEADGAGTSLPTDAPSAQSEADRSEAAIDAVLNPPSNPAIEKAATPRRRIVVEKITRADLIKAREEARIAAEPVTALKDPPPLPDAEEARILENLQNLQSEPETGVETQVETPDEGPKPDAPDQELTHDTPEEEVVSKVAETIPETSSPETSDVSDAQTDLERALSDLDEDEEQELLSAQESARDARRAKLAALETRGDDELDRLMSTTSSRLDHDESSGRRASIAHLKAAVAATKADSSITDAAANQESRERDQYAEDLARVVRPERAQPVSDTPKSDQPAPLVLVSALRIDKQTTDNEETPVSDSPEAAEDIKPRRVTSSDTEEKSPEHDEDRNIFTDQSHATFTDYAAASNALELPDLLEAAAAYYTFVEETGTFTRPMLMRKIAPISAEQNLTREQSLRSFGTLLRDGKLVKVQNGKFEIAKTSRFAPQARYAGE